MRIKFKDYTLESDNPLIMGILNVTPDSFYDGGRYINEREIEKRIYTLIEEGADIIDIGGVSTRPGFLSVDEQTELSRVLRALALVKEQSNIPVSVDTFNPNVAKKAIENGADIINDVSRLNDRMFDIVKRTKAGYIATHTHLGASSYTGYEGIRDYFDRVLAQFAEEGLDDRLMLDVGIGFGKKWNESIAVIKHLGDIKKGFKQPFLVGLSRKSFIADICGDRFSSQPQNRLGGTIAANTAAILAGADILRVHDVKECKQAAIIARCIADMK